MLIYHDFWLLHFVVCLYQHALGEFVRSVFFDLHLTPNLSAMEKLVKSDWETSLGNLFLCKKEQTYYLHNEQKMTTVPLDVAPERRTKRCSPRFQPGGRFWNQGSDTCRQAVRERIVGP